MMALFKTRCKPKNNISIPRASARDSHVDALSTRRSPKVNGNALQSKIFAGLVVEQKNILLAFATRLSSLRALNHPP